MSNYIKEYIVLGRSYGIEDFKSPGEHFFDGRDGIGGKPLPRFMLWAGGCGIGEAKTLDEAYDKLYQYIWVEVRGKLRSAEIAVEVTRQVFNKLASATGNLTHFKVNKRGKK